MTNSFMSTRLKASHTTKPYKEKACVCVEFLYIKYSQRGPSISDESNFAPATGILGNVNSSLLMFEVSLSLSQMRGIKEREKCKAMGQNNIFSLVFSNVKQFQFDIVYFALSFTSHLVSLPLPLSSSNWKC